MLFYENLEKIVFHRHEMFDVDELIVLSGYVGPQPVSRLQTLPFKSSVIYGMYGIDNISDKLHKSLNKLNEDITNISIQYSNLPVHSKCYIWRKNTKIVTALIGSANFSISGLSNPYKEVLAETTYDTFEPLNKYLDIILDNCIFCDDSTVKFKKMARTFEIEGAADMLLGVCRATLLDKYGEVPKKSGLNWGLSEAHTTLGDAYITVSYTHLRAHETRHDLV